VGVVARESRFALPERERRFLVAEEPPQGGECREISDRYLDGTRLRLRRVVHPSGALELKLTQKLPGDPWGRLTTLYLDEPEYDVLAGLPAATLTKRRYRVAESYDVVDVFEGALTGLVVAEIEFDDEGAAEAYVPPDGCVEVTRDPSFTGGALARADAPAVLRRAHDLLARTL